MYIVTPWSPGIYCGKPPDSESAAQGRGVRGFQCTMYMYMYVVQMHVHLQCHV